MMKKFLVTAAYGQWAVGFNSEPEAYAALLDYMKKLGNYDLAEDASPENLDLEALDPLGYFTVIPWYLPDNSQVPSTDLTSDDFEMTGFVLKDEDGAAAYGFFEEYDDGEAYFKDHQEALNIPDFTEEIYPLEINNNFK